MLEARPHKRPIGMGGDDCYHANGSVRSTFKQVQGLLITCEKRTKTAPRWRRLRNRPSAWVDQPHDLLLAAPRKTSIAVTNPRSESAASATVLTRSSSRLSFIDRMHANVRRTE